MPKPGCTERSWRCERRTFLQASAGWLGAHWLGVAAVKGAAKEPKASSSGWVRLFNGKDLTGLYGWLKDTKY